VADVPSVLMGLSDLNDRGNTWCKPSILIDHHLMMDLIDVIECGNIW